MNVHEYKVRGGIGTQPTNSLLYAFQHVQHFYWRIYFFEHFYQILAGGSLIFYY